MKEQKTRPSVSSMAMTAVFLLAIFFFCISSLVTAPGALIDSLGFTAARKYLKDQFNYTPMENLKARVASLDASLGENLYLSREFGWLSSSFQIALGKRVVSTGSSQLLRQDNGYLYDMLPDCDLREGCDEIAALRDEVAGDCDFLYVYQQADTYGDVVLPKGYIDLDYSDEVAGKILERMDENGVEVLDTRDVLQNSGYSQEELMLRTDQHWANLSSLLCARALAERVQEITGTPFALEKLDLDSFTSQVYENVLFGEYARRIGPFNTVLDDVTVFLPKYDTHISRYSERFRNKVSYETEGTFQEAAIHLERLERTEYNATEMANGVYGFTEYTERFHNDDGAPLSVLILKDSYGSPLGTFLSLVVRDVVLVDLRKTSQDAMEFVEMCDPDIIVVAYSQRMIYDNEYTLIAEK